MKILQVQKTTNSQMQLVNGRGIAKQESEEINGMVKSGTLGHPPAWVVPDLEPPRRPSKPFKQIHSCLIHSFVRSFNKYFLSTCVSGIVLGVWAISANKAEKLPSWQLHCNGGR